MKRIKNFESYSLESFGEISPDILMTDISDLMHMGSEEIINFLKRSFRAYCQFSSEENICNTLLDKYMIHYDSRLHFLEFKYSDGREIDPRKTIELDKYDPMSGEYRKGSIEVDNINTDIMIRLSLKIKKMITHAELTTSDYWDDDPYHKYFIKKINDTVKVETIEDLVDRLYYVIDQIDVDRALQGEYNISDSINIHTGIMNRINEVSVIDVMDEISDSLDPLLMKTPRQIKTYLKKVIDLLISYGEFDNEMCKDKLLSWRVINIDARKNIIQFEYKYYKQFDEPVVVIGDDTDSGNAEAFSDYVDMTVTLDLFYIENRAESRIEVIADFGENGPDPVVGIDYYHRDVDSVYSLIKVMCRLIEEAHYSYDIET